MLKLISLVLLLHTAPIGAAESEAGSTEKVYRDYAEAYQKAAQTYENAARQSQSSSYITWMVLVFSSSSSSRGPVRLDVPKRLTWIGRWKSTWPTKRYSKR
jgi:hypothetical protein